MADGAKPGDDSATAAPDISIVAPMFNEAENVEKFFERISDVMLKTGLSFEVVCVNDGSRDSTLEHLIAASEKRPEVVVINLSRNFGKDVALSAGIDFARGKGVVPIDSDLQDPPELIPELIAKWREGFDVVFAQRRSRKGESWMKRATAKAFYRVLDRLTDVEIPQNTGDFRLLDRRAVDALKKLPERTRFMKGLFSWVGFKQTHVLYDREARYAGTTKWNYWRLWNFAIDGIVSFSSLPLKVWSYIGGALALFSMLYAGVLIVLKLTNLIPVPGYASIMVAVLFLGGLQLLTLGVIGEYLARIYNEVKGRPLYIVRDVYGPR